SFLLPFQYVLAFSPHPNNTTAHAAMPNVLLLGGHGKVALQLTRILAQNGHTITSVIRNPDHIPDIKSAAGAGKESAVTPLVASMEESTDESAKELVSKGFDWVIWSACKLCTEVAMTGEKVLILSQKYRSWR